MEWNQHINGLRHAENRRLLLGMYPQWDPSVGSGRGGRPWETSNLSAGLLGPAPMSSGLMGEMSSSWGGGGGVLGQNKLRSRVVVVKYDRKPLSNKTLFAFAERFGCLREHLILKNKAFLEMSAHEEALDVVSYYKQHPASLYGKPVSFYLSKTLMFIEKDERALDRPTDKPVKEVKSQGSKVVFFYHLPREDEKKQELLKLAERFGVVEKHLFLTDRAFIQLGSVEDAEMLVKYYTQNPLAFNGRLVRLNICTKYKTLNVNHKQGKSGGDASSQKNGKASNSKPSPSKSSSSTKTREEKKEEEEEKGRKNKEEKVKAAAEEEEEEVEVSGVMEGEEDGEEEQAPDGEEEQAPDGEEEQAPDGEEEQAPVGEVEQAPDGEVEQAPDGEVEQAPVGEVEQAPDGEVEQAPVGAVEQAPDGAEEEPERAECVKKTVEESGDASQEEEKEEEKVADDVTDDTLGDVGELGDAKQGAESEGQMEAAETEASSEEIKEEANMEVAETAEGELPEEEDFPENIEDFVTLDELQEDEDEAQGEWDDPDSTRRGGMRVVNIVGFRRGYQYLNELLRLAQPFGKVVKHLVLDLRPEAFLQFATEEEARAMATFYNGNITASVCGRTVKISHSLSYPTIQSGSSKVVYIGQIPNTKYSDEEVLKLAEPYGNVKKYFLNRIRRECFLEMYNAEDAEKMAADYKVKPLRFNGKRLTLYVSRKYKQLKHGHRVASTKKRANESPPPKSSGGTEEPPDKKSKEEPEEQKREEEGEGCDVSGEQMATDEKSAVKKEEQMETSTNQDGQTEAPPPPAENKPSTASLPLPPYDTTTPIGAEHVKAGFYCRICFLFYSNEDTAKKTHCSSQAHYDKLQKYLEKEQSKTEEEVTAT